MHAVLVGAILATHRPVVVEPSESPAVLLFELIEEQPIASETREIKKAQEQPNEPEVPEKEAATEQPQFAEPSPVVEQRKEEKPQEEIEDHSSATSADSTAAERARIMTDPKAINRIEPHYPRSARRNHHEGSVVVRFEVTEDGSVRSAEVAHSSGHRDLDAAALEAVLKARFLPATVNGLAIAASSCLTLEFRLK